VDGLFIGISNFDPIANRLPTPAHALGAALAYSLFHQVAARSSNQDASPLKLWAILRLNPEDQTLRASEVYSALDSLPGVAPWEYSKGFDTLKDHMFDYLRSDSPQTRASILETIRAQAQRVRSHRPAERPLAILYLATHGMLGNDGTRYAMASDSNENDPTTWISYQEIADAFANLDDPEHPISVIIILDTCLVNEHSRLTAAPLRVPPSVMFISAAAPGQYSWHWTEANESLLLKGSVGSGLLRRRLTPADLSYYSSLSVVPVAMAAGVSEKEHLAYAMCGSNPTRPSWRTTSYDLAISIKSGVPRFVGQLEENTQAAVQSVDIMMDTHTAQSLSDAAADSSPQLRLFNFACKGDEDRGPFPPRCYDCSDWEHTTSTDVNEIAGLETLEELNLAGKRLQHIDGLKKAIHLQTLNLSRTNITDLDVLRGLTELRELHLANLNLLTDVDALKNLTNLRDLDLVGSTVVNIEGLQKLTLLEKLDLRETPVTNAEALKNLDHLEFRVIVETSG
jgi:hypothetical protein